MGERAHYKIIIEPLSEEDGGGIVATVPDLPGCMSDGANRIRSGAERAGCNRVLD
ncbi:type II toxin-antitoxin system HicB family antitoxin [Bradyrhizobium sp. DASA03005]|uniref:type II toxin-antitoxin system HicB family antitoxin n=1 Tax=Bradyrhizobium TaxID=374 RepID=UPI0027B9AEB5|nr:MULTISPECIES: hypothetical protein [Bradyrhizobium]